MSKRTRPTKRITKPPKRNVLKDVTLVALQNNIKILCGYLNDEVESAFRAWIEVDGFTEFMRWLKRRERDKKKKEKEEKTPSASCEEQAQ